MKHLRWRTLACWLPALTWAGIIFGLSTLPMKHHPPRWVIPNDKLVHAVLFGILSLCIYFGLRKGHRLTPWFAAAGACLLASLYGATDEIHQHWTPTRRPDVMDWVADTVGAACVFLLALLPSRRHEPEHGRNANP